MTIKGVVFDMDGVLLDTEKLYVRFWCKAAEFYGYPMQKEHALSIRSLSRPFAIEKLKGYFGNDFDYYAVHSKRIELMDEYIRCYGIKAKPYASYLLRWLKKNRYKIAVATATAPDRTERYLIKTDLYDYFDEIICASMVNNGKPEPDIYLKACESLNLEPQQCLALEDSKNGLYSASRAGCKVVMVPDLDEPDDECLGLVYAVVKNLKEVTDLLSKEDDSSQAQIKIQKINCFFVVEQ